MVFSIQKYTSDGKVARTLSTTYETQHLAEHVAAMLHEYVHADGNKDVGYGVQVVDSKGAWVWRRNLDTDYLGLDAERP